VVGNLQSRLEKRREGRSAASLSTKKILSGLADGGFAMPVWGSGNLRFPRPTGHVNHGITASKFIGINVEVGILEMR
jgi:hypothetical protein